MKQHKPVVLTIAGHDPTGGAGIQADIETLSSLGVSPISVITALTCQNTFDVQDIIPQEPRVLSRQLRTLLADIPVDAIKIGLLGSDRLIPVIADCIRELPREIPVVIDPIMAAGGGRSMANEKTRQKLLKELLPMATLLTPNLAEARQLGVDNEWPVSELLSTGCKAVLLTTTDSSSGPRIEHFLYRPGQPTRVFHAERLPGRFHGSGCTLSSAITACLARGMLLEQAVDQAQHYTMRCLSAGQALGKGQLIPDRFFWTTECPPFPDKDSTP